MTQLLIGNFRIDGKLKEDIKTLKKVKYIIQGDKKGNITSINQLILHECVCYLDSIRMAVPTQNPGTLLPS